MFNYVHSGPTIVKQDPFDLERLLMARNGALAFLRNQRGICAPAVAWHWRGIGCLRFLQQTERGCVKHLHVWHKDLILPGIENGGGDIHEHNFTLVSDVLYGKLRHTWFEDDATYRDALEYDVYKFDQSLEPVGTLKALGEPMEIEALCSYAFEPNEFHSSTPLSEVAVTRCAKLNMHKGSARALVQKGRKPVISTPFEPLPETTFKRVIDCAIAALESA